MVCAEEQGHRETSLTTGGVLCNLRHVPGEFSFLLISFSVFKFPLKWVKFSILQFASPLHSIFSHLSSCFYFFFGCILVLGKVHCCGYMCLHQSVLVAAKLPLPELDEFSSARLVSFLLL